MRQLAHDLHNDLNALDLAATYINELVEAPAAKEELGTQRETIHRMSRVLHTLSLYLQPPHPEKVTLPAAELAEGFRERILSSHPDGATALSWSCKVGDSRVDVDFQMITAALAEVFENALLSRDGGATVDFSATLEGGMLRLRFSEKKPRRRRRWTGWGASRLSP